MPDKKQHISPMTIDASKKLSVIQKEFNTHYPYLKLEFFKRRHEVRAGSLKKDMIMQDVTLQQLQSGNTTTTEALVITPDMPVFRLEQMFQERYKIAVQVFRKSGRSWLETSLTDDWTLRHQNEQGKELSYFG
jgi:glycerol-3-phosphate O-acyltransferase